VLTIRVSRNITEATCDVRHGAVVTVTPDPLATPTRRAEVWLDGNGGRLVLAGPPAALRAVLQFALDHLDGPRAQARVHPNGQTTRYSRPPTPEPEEAA
jgi:hypothetical protein